MTPTTALSELIAFAPKAAHSVTEKHLYNYEGDQQKQLRYEIACHIRGDCEVFTGSDLEKLQKLALDYLQSKLTLIPPLSL